MGLCGLYGCGECLFPRAFRAHTPELAEREIGRLFRGVCLKPRGTDDSVTLLAEAVERVCEKSEDIRLCFDAYRETGEKFGRLAASHGWFHWALGTPLSFVRPVLFLHMGTENAAFDDLMFGFYDRRLEEISRDLGLFDCNEGRADAVREGIAAYRGGLYRAATLSFLTLFDRLVYEKSDFPLRHKTAELLRRFGLLADRADAAHGVFTSSPFRSLVLGGVYANADLRSPPPAEGIPGRHTLLHGFRTGCATKKTALNALLLVLILLTLPAIRTKTYSERLALAGLP